MSPAPLAGLSHRGPAPRALSVTYTGEPDVVHEFRTEGQAYVFGRDSDAADIVIWSALNDPSLSRAAGRIWLMDGELWLRNLSMHHDLLIQVPGMPPEPYLPPRRDESEPGPARSLPLETCVVLAPAGCELLVRQSGPFAPAVEPAHLRTAAEAGLEPTVRLPDVPEHLRDVAQALCAPLLGGSRLPATYAQVARELDISSHKKIRMLVAELCDLYRTAAPELAESVRDRQAREELLVSALARHEARKVGGIWRFEDRDGDAAEADLERRRALMLPDYFEVAHLLVRRGLVQTRP